MYRTKYRKIPVYFEHNNRSVGLSRYAQKYLNTKQQVLQTKYAFYVKNEETYLPSSSLDTIGDLNLLYFIYQKMNRSFT